jgi:hypothetical protein
MDASLDEDVDVANYPKIHPHLRRHNSVRMHLYANPQHIKVLKDFVYMLLM